MRAEKTPLAHVDTAGRAHRQLLGDLELEGVVEDRRNVGGDLGRGENARLDEELAREVVDRECCANSESFRVGFRGEALVDRVAAYTPVPGGVGPMTINTLILQSVTAAEKSLG